MFKVGDRVRWVVYGIEYTGTISKIFEENKIYCGNKWVYEKGDMFVIPDNPQYSGQRVLIFPGRCEKIGT